MSLTTRELVELEQLIATAWGESSHDTVMISLMLNTAKPTKLRNLLNSRAKDLEHEEPETAKRLRYFAKNFGGRTLVDTKEAAYRRYYRSKMKEFFRTSY